MLSEILRSLIQSNQDESTTAIKVIGSLQKLPFIFETFGHQFELFYLQRFTAIAHEEFYQSLAQRGANKFVLDYRNNLKKLVHLEDLINELDSSDEGYQNQLDLTYEIERNFTNLLAKYGKACRGCMWQNLYDDLYPESQLTFNFSVHPEIYWSGLGLEYLLPPDFRLGDRWDADYWPEETQGISDIFSDFLVPSIPVPTADSSSWWSSYRKDEYWWLEVISRRYYSTHPIFSPTGHDHFLNSKFKIQNSRIKKKINA